MAESSDEHPTGPDLAAGVAAGDVGEGALLVGHVGGEPVVVTRTEGALFAVGAHCTHYGGPLGEGIVLDDTIRCPWHHACFSLRTGEALAAPALDPIPAYRVEERDGRVFVRDRIESRRSSFARTPPHDVRHVVIVGAGAAGVAAAQMLRRCGYDGAITMLDQLHTLPVDRPNLSKDYLAGTAQEEWVNLRPEEFYTEHRIELVRGARVTRIDVAGRAVETDGGRLHPFDRLLIATGATPNELPIPGADRPSVHYLRTLDDSKSIIAAAQEGKRAVVIGASFIGLEVAASLRARTVDVTVVAPDALPLERVLGAELGRMIQARHEAAGVHFRLGTRPVEIADDAVLLDGGDRIAADFVVIGVGVKPDVALARDAGLLVDDGVVVSDQLETSAPGIYAAGDIASWPDPRVGRIRVEHWVVAERQGQTAARNMLGAAEGFTAPPFFWSMHYDVVVNYCGHALRGDAHSLSGDPMAHDCTVAYRAPDGTLHAEADVGRDRENLGAEVVLAEQGV